MNKNKNILKSLSKGKNIIWGEMEIIQLSESDDDEIKEIIIIDDKAIDINKNIKQEKEKLDNLMQEIKKENLHLKIH